MTLAAEIVAALQGNFDHANGKASATKGLERELWAAHRAGAELCLRSALQLRARRAGDGFVVGDDGRARRAP